MSEAVRAYLSICNTCQRYNYKYVSPAGKLISIKVTYPLECIGMDLIGHYPLSNSNRCRFVFVIAGYFSKWVEFVPFRKASTPALPMLYFIILFLNMVHKLE